MVDSTNPRIMADNIKKLAQASGSGGITVEANPEGTATEDLVKLLIDDIIYSVPTYTPPVYSAEFDTGKKYNNKTVYGAILTGTVPETTSESNIFAIPTNDKILIFVWNAAKGGDIYLPGSEYIYGRISGGYFKIKLSSPSPYGAAVTGYIEYTKSES